MASSSSPALPSMTRETTAEAEAAEAIVRADSSAPGGYTTTDRTKSDMLPLRRLPTIVVRWDGTDASDEACCDAPLRNPLHLARDCFSDEVPLAFRVWAGWVTFINSCSLLWFAADGDRFSEAVGIFFAWLLCLGFMMILYMLFAWTRVLSLARLVSWVPLFVYLCLQFNDGALDDRDGTQTLYSIYLVLVATTIGLSLLVDIYDVALHVTGVESNSRVKYGPTRHQSLRRIALNNANIDALDGKLDGKITRHTSTADAV